MVDAAHIGHAVITAGETSEAAQDRLVLLGSAW
jgi:hypothetical protein